MSSHNKKTTTPTKTTTAYLLGARLYPSARGGVHVQHRFHGGEARDGAYLRRHVLEHHGRTAMLGAAQPFKQQGETGAVGAAHAGEVDSDRAALAEPLPRLPPLRGHGVECQFARHDIAAVAVAIEVERIHFTSCRLRSLKVAMSLSRPFWRT